MMTCRFCLAPINTGAFAHNKSLRSWSHEFELRECLNLLTYSCINCFGEIVRLQNVVPRRPYRSEYDVRRARKTRIKWADELTEAEKEIVEINRQEPNAYLARCIARHVANLIAKATKEKTTKRKRTQPEEIVIHPQEANDREVLMLEICAEIANFYRNDNRDMSSDARMYGTAAFWKHSAHFRHLRKQLGIKGNVCAAMKEDDRRWSDDATGRLWAAFESSRSFRECVSRIESRLKKDGGAVYRASYVWGQVYEELMAPATIPLSVRLASYKWSKERQSRMRAWR